MNDYHFKLVKLQGDFVWHDHPDTDDNTGGVVSEQTAPAEAWI